MPPMTKQKNTADKIAQNEISEMYLAIFLCETYLLLWNCDGNERTAIWFSKAEHN